MSSEQSRKETARLLIKENTPVEPADLIVQLRKLTEIGSTGQILIVKDKGAAGRYDFGGFLDHVVEMTLVGRDVVEYPLSGAPRYRIAKINQVMIDMDAEFHNPVHRPVK